MEKSNIKINASYQEDDKPITSEVGQLSVDIFQTNNQIVLLAPIAGIKEKDISISITDDVLVIKGQRHLNKEVEEKDYMAKECFWGDFARSILLPINADKDSVSASFDNGVLEITIGKKDIERTKIIKIKHSDED